MLLSFFLLYIPSLFTMIFFFFFLLYVSFSDLVTSPHESEMDLPAHLNYRDTNHWCMHLLEGPFLGYCRLTNTPQSLYNTIVGVHSINRVS